MSESAKEKLCVGACPNQAISLNSTGMIESGMALDPFPVSFFSNGNAGLKPGLLQKYQSARTAGQKFDLLKAFMLDPSMNGVEIETEYVEQSKKQEGDNWSEKPLHELRLKYTTPEAKKFLEQNIIAKQSGRNHPQDPEGTNPEMKLFWIFEQSTESTTNSSKIGSRTSARAEVPSNKAARAALTDSLTATAAEFHGKGKGSHVPAPVPAEGKSKNKKGGKGKGNGKDKNKAGSKLSGPRYI